MIIFDFLKKKLKDINCYLEIYDKYVPKFSGSNYRTFLLKLDRQEIDLYNELVHIGFIYTNKKQLQNKYVSKQLENKSLRLAILLNKTFDTYQGKREQLEDLKESVYNLLNEVEE